MGERSRQRRRDDERGRGHGRRVRVRRWSRPGDGPTRRSSGSRVGAGRPAAPARAPAALRRLPEPLLQAPVLARPEGPRAPRPAGRGAGPPPAGRGPDRGHGQRPGLQPGPGCERLAVGAHGRPDRHRRHALPRRLGPHGDDGDGARHPPRHPPDAPGGPRRRHVRPGRGGDRQRGLDLRGGRPLRRHTPGAAPPAPRRRARRRPRRGDRLAADAGPLRPAGPRAGAQRAAARHGRGDARRAVPALAQRRSPRLPRVPRVRLRPRGRGRRRRRGGARHRPGSAAGRPADGGAAPALVGDARGPPDGVRAGGPDAHDGQQPQHRLPRRLPGLHRRQAVRPRRPGHRRAPLPRALQLRRLPRQRARHPAPAGQGRGGAGPGRLRGREPQRAGPAPDPRDVPPQRAVPDRRRRAVRDRDGHPRAPGPAPGPPVRAAGRLRPVRLLPRVPPARPLLDRSGRADRHARSRRPTAARAPSTRS